MSFSSCDRHVAMDQQIGKYVIFVKSKSWPSVDSLALFSIQSQETVYIMSLPKSQLQEILLDKIIFPGQTADSLAVA